MRNYGLDKLLERRSPDAMPQDPADLMYLYGKVMDTNVERAIEFGSGQSTLFIAQALHDHGHGHLWSLDADAEWLAHTEQMFPEHLRSYVTFIHSQIAVNHDYGIPAYEYLVVPDGEWDFVLIDGPALTDEVKASCDLIKLAPAIRGVGMVDHRWRSVVLARERAGDKLRFRFTPSLESFVFQRRRQS